MDSVSLPQSEVQFVCIIASAFVRRSRRLREHLHTLIDRMTAFGTISLLTHPKFDFSAVVATPRTA
jgi:hypothetical protein